MYQLDSSHVWHVAKSGSDGNSGHAGQYPVNLANNAKLTIGAAISAASDGDTIIVWPGTYVENVVLNKQLYLVGAGNRYSIIINPASGIGILISASGCRVGSISAISSNDSGINVNNHKAQLINCYAEGITGIANNHKSYWFAKNCYGKGKKYGIDLSDGYNIQIIDCICETDGSGATTWAAALKTDYCTTVIIKNISCYATQALNGEGYHIYGGIIRGNNVVLENISCHASHIGTGNHETIGLKIAAMGYGTGKNNIPTISINGASITAEVDYGYVYGTKIEQGNSLMNGLISNSKNLSRFISQVPGQVSGYEKIQFIDNNFNTAPNDSFNNWWITWTTGNNKNTKQQVLDWETTPNRMTLASACTYDIQIGDTYIIEKYSVIKKDIVQSGPGIIKLANCQYDPNSIEGTVINIDNIADINGRVDVSKFSGSEDNVLRLNTTTKLLTNRAIQNKSTGAI